MHKPHATITKLAVAPRIRRLTAQRKAATVDSVGPIIKANEATAKRISFRGSRQSTYTCAPS